MSDRPGYAVSTARWIAAARARESARPDALFSDPYAAALAGDLGWRMLEAAERASGTADVYLPIRTRFFDDVLTGDIRAGDQVVLPGGGLDTRAFRLPLPGDLAWFEIDDDALLRAKAATLDAAGARCGARSWHLVAADLTGSWADALDGAGFVAGRRTVWVAEGVLFYLPVTRVLALLRAAARLSGPRSLFVADVFGSGLLRLPSMGGYLEARSSAGLPPPFTTDDPVGLFRDGGWPEVELTEPQLLARRSGRSVRVAGPVPADDPTMRTFLVVARLPA